MEEIKALWREVEPGTWKLEEEGAARPSHITCWRLLMSRSH